ncbi:hypothetical protein JCM10450v2_006409 [Rhodotorula kratochvilovae]
MDHVERPPAPALPHELLVLVIKFLDEPGPMDVWSHAAELSRLSLVSKTFYAAALDELYRRITLFPTGDGVKRDVRTNTLLRLLAAREDLRDIVREVSIPAHPMCDLMQEDCHAFADLLVEFSDLTAIKASVAHTSADSIYRAISCHSRTLRTLKLVGHVDSRLVRRIYTLPRLETLHLVGDMWPLPESPFSPVAFQLRELHLPHTGDVEEIETLIASSHFSLRTLSVGNSVASSALNLALHRNLGYLALTIIDEPNNPGVDLRDNAIATLRSAAAVPSLRMLAFRKSPMSEYWGDEDAPWVLHPVLDACPPSVQRLSLEHCYYTAGDIRALMHDKNRVPNLKQIRYSVVTLGLYGQPGLLVQEERQGLEAFAKVKGCRLEWVDKL